MEYIHIKNLEKYHPGYKDRVFIWVKAYCSMLNADPEFEMLNEIDKWRFLALIMLEIQSHQPTPINDEYLTRKGFDLVTRPMLLTMQMLQNFINVGTNPLQDFENVVLRVDKSRVDKNRQEEQFLEFWNKYPRKIAKTQALKAFLKLSPNDELLKLILMGVETHSKTDQWIKDDGKFIPHPATWLNQRRWEDELTTIGVLNGKPREQNF